MSRGANPTNQYKYRRFRLVVELCDSVDQRPASSGTLVVIHETGDDLNEILLEYFFTRPRYKKKMVAVSSQPVTPAKRMGAFCIKTKKKADISSPSPPSTLTV